MINRTSEGTAFETYGQLKAPAVVLIHGLGLSRRIFDRMLEATSASQKPRCPIEHAHAPSSHSGSRNLCRFDEQPPQDRSSGDKFDNHFHVITYDLYGHGDSSPAPTNPSLELYSLQIKLLLDHLKITKAHIIGFSIGGMINRRFAMDFPHILDRLVIWNSPHDSGDSAQKAVEDRANLVREQGRMSTLAEALQRWFTPEFIAKEPETVDFVRQWRAQMDDESYAQAAWVLANGVRELIAPPIKIKAPTLIMTCQNDSGSTPQHMHQISAEIHGSETIEIPTLKHLGIMENTSAFIEPTIQFLTRNIERS